MSERPLGAHAGSAGRLPAGTGKLRFDLRPAPFLFLHAPTVHGHQLAPPSTWRATDEKPRALGTQPFPAAPAIPRLQEVVSDAGLVRLEIKGRAGLKDGMPPAQAAALELPRHP
eukprot:9496858-Alexandrium_andersonii.AAC.1